MDKFIDNLLRFPLRIMLFGTLVLFALAAGITQIYMETGIDVFFSDDDPNLLAERKIEDIYGDYDTILIVIDSGDIGVFNVKYLSAIEQLTARAWKTPYSRRVDSITNFQYPTVDGDDIAIGDLIEQAATLTSHEVARLQHTALAQQALVGRLLSSNADVTAINISLAFPKDNKAAAVAEAVGYIRELTIAVESAHPNLEIYLAGSALTEQTLAEVTMADGRSLMPVLFIVVLAMVAILLQSLLAALCTVIAIFLSILAGMGYAGWAGIGLNSVNVSAPTIIMTLAIADCVHLLSAFLARLRTGDSKFVALRYGLKQTIYPIFLTSVTTALGFLSMNFSESPPFRELGTIAAVGVIGALGVTISILPGLILLLPFKGGAKHRTGLPVRALGDFVSSHYNLVFYGSSIVIALALSFLPRIELNDDPTTYFSEAIPLTQAMHVIETKLSGTQSLEYSFDSGEPEGAADPEFLRQTAEFVSWLRQQPEVVNVESYTDTLQRLNQVMHNDANEWFRLPDNRALAAQYMLLYEMSVPYGLDVTHQVSMDKSALKVTVVLKNQKSQGLIAFEERSRQWLLQNLPKIATRGAGQAISFAHVGLKNIRSMLSGSLVAMLLISTCLVLAFRSVKYGLLSLVPNLFPALVALGIWGALVGEVNMAASVVFSLTLGIIVDDTTHFLVKYIQARREQNVGAEAAVRYAFANVGGALVTTSIVLAAGFMVLVLSDFAVNSTSGLLVAMTITVAIVLDFLFLPALLIKADKWLHLGSPEKGSVG